MDPVWFATERKESYIQGFSFFPPSHTAATEAASLNLIKKKGLKKGKKKRRTECVLVQCKQQLCGGTLMINDSKFFLLLFFTQRMCTHTHTASVCLFCPSPPPPPSRCASRTRNCLQLQTTKAPFSILTLLFFSSRSLRVYSLFPLPNELIKPKPPSLLPLLLLLPFVVLAV